MNQKAIDFPELRRLAEGKLASASKPIEGDFDSMRLVHELQVHQIELEIQNEELVASNSALELLRAKYQALFDAAPVGYITLSERCEIIEANPVAQRMLGPRDYLSATLRLRECFAADSVAAFDAFFNGLSGTEEHASADDLVLLKQGAVPIYVRAQGKLLQSAAGALPFALVVLMDVSALKYAIEDVLSVIRP